MKKPEDSGDANIAKETMGGAMSDFFKTNQKWLALLGALVISSSLTAKDKLGEQGRELSSKVDAAESLRKVRAFGESVNTKINKLADDLAVVREQTETKNREADVLRDDAKKERYVADINHLNLLIEELKGLLALVDSPDKEDMKSQVNDLEIRVGTIKLDDIEHLFGEGHSQWEQALTPQERNALGSKGEREIYLQRSIKGVGDDIDTHLKAFSITLNLQKARAERIKTVVGFICYSLVVFGFLLSLPAKVLEAKNKATGK